ncbi:MAG: nuclear transport factor 2 family protein [Gloeobacteraceae cyanobacterium ES-bin-316]|nr:nuclear transport factor 2 family protein [Ferruginibacter sp.]
MKKFIAFIFILLFVTGHMHAQTKDEIGVASAAEQFRLALISGNEKELRSLVARKLSYGQIGGYVEGKDEFVEKLVSKKPDFIGITIDDQVISVTRRTAIVRHIFSAETKDGNTAGRIKLKVMLVFIKVNGYWKLLARQAFKTG